MDLATALASNGDLRPWVTARLLAINTTTNRAQVSIDGSEPVWLPFAPGVYDGITTVFVLRDPLGSGAGELVIAPGYAEPPEAVPPAPAAPTPPATPDAPSMVSDAAVIRPTWSGTYRHMRGAWDRWNTTRYGGRSTLYQGSEFGSGQLTGLAVYGDQVRNLGAAQITRIVVSTPPATGSGNVTLQGSPHGAKPGGAPSTTGGTASGSSSVALPASVCEAFRTGTVKGLATVGGNYRATFGTSRADGMSLAITYLRPA